MKGRYKIVIVLWLLGALIYTLMFLPAEHRIKNIYQDKQDIDIHKITNKQINKHQYILTHKLNKSLKLLLKLHAKK